MTLNQQIALIEQFANQHAQINLSRFAPEYDIHGLKQQDGYVLWYFVEPSTVSGTSIRTSFVFTCMDVIDDGKTNLAEIYSDSLQILQDLQAYLLYYTDELDEAGNAYNYDIERSGNFEPGEAMFNQYYAGHTVRFTFVSGYTYDQCAIPVIPAPYTEGYFLLIDDTHFLLIDDTHKLIIQ